MLRWRAIAAGGAALAAACDEPELPVVAPPLDEVLELVEVIELEEEQEPLFPDGTVMYPNVGPGTFLERRDGSLVVGDRTLPRVRAYFADGSWEASFGRHGDGPFELRGISGLAETASGKIVVSSSTRTWLTYLNADLTPDSLLPVPGFRVGAIWAVGEDLVFRGTTSEHEGLFHRMVDGKRVWSSWTTPAFDKPYWGPLSGMAMAVAGDSIYAMAGALYPLTVLNGAGDSVGTIGSPPPWFRVLPDIPAGTFAYRAGSGETPDYSALPRILASFDRVSKVSVVGDDYLVFTLGGLDPAAAPSFRSIHTSIEVYNRHTGQKLVESVHLPEGSWVLGGGRYLYVLVDRDLPPWRIAKYRLIVEE